MNPLKQSVRLTRTKHVKFKGVSVAQDRTEVKMKGRQSEKILKQMTATNERTNKGCGIKDAIGQWARNKWRRWNTKRRDHL